MLQSTKEPDFAVITRGVPNLKVKSQAGTMTKNTLKMSQTVKMWPKEHLQN